MKPGSSNIDWSSTEAYALGLNGLYLNIAGREKHGIVDSGEKKRAILQICANNCSPSAIPLTVAQSSMLCSKLIRPETTPESRQILIVGYSPGYRASWQTGLGGTPPLEIEDNTDAWIGDHCIDPADVPGVLFTTRKLRGCAPQVAGCHCVRSRNFGIAGGAPMSGHSVF